MNKSGWKLSEEAKAKMRLAWEKRKLIPFSMETRQKMSKARLGKLNHNWKGGNIKSTVKMVKERDDYTCKKCGFRDDPIMVVDHINPRFIRPDLELHPDNLMTLCPNCHARKTIKDRKIIAKFKKEKSFMMRSKYQNSLCKRGHLHEFIPIRLTNLGSYERCKKCGLKMHFPSSMPNHLYLSYHIRSILRADDSLFKREYPNAT